MPTLIRLLVVLALIVCGVYGAMIAMVTFLHPQPHEIVETIQLPKPAKAPDVAEAAPRQRG